MANGRKNQPTKELQAVNDEMHERFYGKLEYKDCTNLKIKAKWL